MNSIRLAVLILFFLGGAAQQTDAQQVASLCGLELRNQVPANFQGSVYYTPSQLLNPDEPPVLRQISADFERDYAIPASLQDTFTQRRPRISPDGRYVVLRPIANETQLILWDIASGLVRSTELDNATAALVRGDNLNRPERNSVRFHSLLRWQNSNTLAIEASLPWEISIISAEQTFVITDGQLALETLTEEQVASTSRENGQATSIDIPSPDGRHVVTALSLYPRDQQVRVMDIESNQVVFEYAGSFERWILPVPLWLNEGNFWFYREAFSGLGSHFNVFQTSEAFTRDNNFDDLMEQHFGSAFIDNGLTPAVSSDNNRVVFMISVRTSEQSYDYALVIYEPALRALRSICVRTQSNYSVGEASWIQDDQLIAVTLGSGLQLFQVETGNAYSFDGQVLGMTGGSLFQENPHHPAD